MRTTRAHLTRFHALSITLAAILVPIVVATLPARADVVTNSNNLLRNGWYPDQAALTPATVGGGNFGQQFSSAVDGQVYAQPVISQGTLLVATENNFAYGLDPATGAHKWQQSYGTPFNASDIGCGDLAPHVGITGTPVVDPATNIAYFLSKQYVTGNTGTVEYLAHAVDVATGTEQSGWPITIQGYADNASQIAAHHFNAFTQLQRPGLLLMNGVVYAAFGSSCDFTPYTGWIVGLSTTTHSITTMFTTIRDDNAGSGIWQAGSGLVSDGPGQILFSTGNGGWDLTAARPGSQPPNDLSEAVARVVVQPDGTLKPVDFFAPYDGPTLEANDLDFGSGGPVGLPDAYFGTPSHPHLLVMQGKQGYVYLLDRDNLGGYLQGPAGGDGVVAKVGPTGGVWSRPAVWPGDGGYVYVVTANGSGGQGAGSSGFLRAYKYGLDGSANPTLALAGSSVDTFGFGSGAPIITSNGVGSGTALLWVVWEPDGTGANAQLRAYDPVPVGSPGHFTPLWSAPIGTASKFSMPVADGGHIYVGTRDGHVLGFWSPLNAPLVASPPAPHLPSTPVGVPTPPTTVTFTAQKATTVNDFTSTNAAFALGAPSRSLPAVLAPGDTVSVPITFTPTQVGLASTTLRADTTDGPVDVGVDAVGEAATAQLVVSPGQLSLGGTSAGGAPLSDSFTIANAGATDLHIGTIDLPAAGSQFTLSGAPSPGTTIGAGGSVSTLVTFTPTAGAANQQYDATFTVHSDGGTHAVDVTAVVAAPPHVTISPGALNIGAVPLGSVTDVNFTLRNSGGLSASFVRSKPPAKNVGWVANTTLPEGTPLAAGGSVTETVRFRATKPGTFSDAWSLNPADGLGVRNITFTARVVANETLPPPTTTAWQLNDSAQFTSSPAASSIRLTAPAGVQVDGSAFLRKTVSSKHLHVAFDAWIGGGTGADGLALVLADPKTTQPTATGVSGGGLGFSGISGIAVALDTFQNQVNPAAPFVGVSNGPALLSGDHSADQLDWIATNSSIPALEDLATVPTGYKLTHVDVQIANGLVNVTVAGVPALTDVPVTLPPNVRLGFTGGSGGDTDEHTVANVQITLARPDTVISAKPAGTVRLATATLAFSSTVAGSTFRCALDNGTPHPCNSPDSVVVAPGAHTMSVQAVDPFGFSDPSPAVAKWTYTPLGQHGYWMLGSDGAVYAFGDARAFGNPHDTTAAHLTPTSTARGYWIVNSSGRVYPFGDARAYGNAGPLAPGELVTSMSATLTNKGYWLFTNAGRVFALGDAASYGDLANVHLNGSIIDSVPTASGRGYYMVASDGGVFAFGDAHFFGSLGATHLNQPIIGLVPTSSGKGYWLDASDGGVFAFGDAHFRGSLGSTVLNRPIVGMVRFGNGYLLASSDGGVFDFSDSPFLGSLGDRVPAAPIVGLAAFDL